MRLALPQLYRQLLVSTTTLLDEVPRPSILTGVGQQMPKRKQTKSYPRAVSDRKLVKLSGPAEVSTRARHPPVTRRSTGSSGWSMG